MPRIKYKRYCKQCKENTLHIAKLQFGGTHRSYICKVCGCEHYVQIQMTEKEKDARENRWLDKLYSKYNPNN